MHQSEIDSYGWKNKEHIFTASKKDSKIDSDIE